MYAMLRKPTRSYIRVEIKVYLLDEVAWPSVRDMTNLSNVKKTENKEN